jgi:hypothetical protein
MTDRPDEPRPERPKILKLSPAQLDELRARYADDEDDESPGGDPACWAHLFEEDESDPPSS